MSYGIEPKKLDDPCRDNIFVRWVNIHEISPDGVEALLSHVLWLEKQLEKARASAERARAKAKQAEATERGVSSEKFIRIRDLADEVFGDNLVAMEWIDDKNLALDNRAPIELIGTEEGFERVKTLLLRIQYGVLA